MLAKESGRFAENSLVYVKLNLTYVDEVLRCWSNFHRLPFEMKSEFP